MLAAHCELTGSVGRVAASGLYALSEEDCFVT